MVEQMENWIAKGFENTSSPSTSVFMSKNPKNLPNPFLANVDDSEDEDDDEDDDDDGFTAKEVTFKI